MNDTPQSTHYKEYPINIKELTSKSEFLLKEILKHEEIFDDLDKDVPKKDILDTYKFEKPLTCLGCLALRQQIKEFVDSMREFFFVGVKPSGVPNHWFVFLSRFRTLIRIAIDYEIPEDKTADLNGILFGYPISSVIGYCITRKSNLIKK